MRKNDLKNRFLKPFLSITEFHDSITVFRIVEIEFAALQNYFSI